MSESTNPIDKNKKMASSSGAAEIKPSTSLLKISIAIFLILLGLLVWQWWTTKNEMISLRQELALRLHQGDSSSKATKLLAEATRNDLVATQVKVTELERLHSESQAEQIALSQIYENISKSRDDWALAEVEHVISVANQELGITGNVKGALLALKNVENNLAQVELSQFVSIREAIQKDILILQGLPDTDISGVIAHIDRIFDQIDDLPVLSDKEQINAEKKVKTAPNLSPEKMPTESFWEKWKRIAWGEFKQLVKINKIGQPMPVLLTPNQAYFVRADLKLRLLNVRHTLFAKNEALYFQELLGAISTLNKYFDTEDKNTLAARKRLKQLLTKKINIDMPNLQSLAAIYAYKNRD